MIGLFMVNILLMSVENVFQAKECTIHRTTEENNCHYYCFVPEMKSLVACVCTVDMAQNGSLPNRTVSVKP